jgi:beta-galactosidase/beta-glucuronidase
MMMTFKVLTIIALCFFFLPIESSSQDSRGILFNNDWKFYKGDVANGEKASLKEDDWRQVQVPHDWSIEGPFSEEWASGTGYLPGGIGWYRKPFEISPDQKNKQIYIYFDGVYKNSEVWINEKYLGKRPNGYASFYYDITPHLKKEGKNLVAVKVDHTDFADSRWYTGSGINRNVYLIATAPVHINLWGVAFTTQSVTKEQASVSVEVSISNASKKMQAVNLLTELISKEGKVLSKAEKKISVSEKGTKEVLEFTVKSPRLWSPENPELYTLKTSISINGKVLDVTEEQVGFRYFSFDANKGFFLNGGSIKLKGVCFHDDAGALGSAVPRDVWERRLLSLKEMGCNAIRMSHNPHQDYLYALCDELGFLVQDEAFDEWEVGKNKWIKGWNVGTPGKDGYSKDFNEWADVDLRDMILRNRNRTSIIMWSIGNEIDYPNDPYTHEILNTGNNPQIYGRGYQEGYPPAQKLADIASRLVKVVKQYDTTRPVTAALAGVVMSNTTTYPELLDVVGYNYQEYRYNEDHKKYPGRIIYGSENGKSVDAWEAVADNDFISAQFLWTGFDFLGEARAWPARSSGAGVIDMAGFPKPQYYHRQALWTSKPVHHLSVAPISKEKDQRRAERLETHWNWTATDSVRVVCYTNSEEAELYLNGKSLGRKKLADSKDKTLVWKMVYQPGSLEVKGFKSGQQTGSYNLVTTGKPEVIKAILDKQSIKANHDEVAHIEINLLDKDGRLVGNAGDEITITIEGPGKLIGLESGSLTSHEDYKSNKRKAVGGKLLAYVQAEAAGQIKVTMSSGQLKSAVVRINAK